MIGRVIRIAAAFTLAGALGASAQETTHDISGVAVPPLGGKVAPELSDDEKARNEFPELAGARLATGSQLLDGKLPQPIVDYIIKTQYTLQRISVFETGLVVIHVEGDRGRILKRVLIPPDALDTYRKELSAEKLAETPIAQLKLKPTGDMAVIRSYDSTGTHVDRVFDPSAILPIDLEQRRRLLEDLLNALVQDREVTNSVTNYKPKIGDRLVGEDQKTYIVSNIYGEGATVELTRADQPLKLYVAQKDLNKFIVGARRPAPPPEEP